MRHSIFVIPTCTICWHNEWGKMNLVYFDKNAFLERSTRNKFAWWKRSRRIRGIIYGKEVFGFEEKWYKQKTKRRQVLQSWKIFDWKKNYKAALEEMEVAGI